MSTKKEARPEPGKAFEGEIIAEIPKNRREVYRVMARTHKWVSLKVEALPGFIKALAGMVEGGQP